MRKIFETYNYKSQGTEKKIRRIEEERTRQGEGKNHQQNEKKTNGKHGLYAVDIKRNK